MEEQYNTIGNQIKKYRKAARLSQKDLGKKMGVTRNTVINWEKGLSRPDTNLFPKLCKELGITLDDIFDIPSEDRFSDHERMLIKKRRKISPFGQRIIDHMILKIYEEEKEVPKDC